MERTRNVIPPNDKIRWKNTGGGILYLVDKRQIAPGEIFIASPNEISLSFRDTVKPLEPIKSEIKIEVIPVKVKYIAKKRDISNWYDVVDSKGKVISEKALKKVEAEEFIKLLEG